jgi:hypothetical protein
MIDYLGNEIKETITNELANCNYFCLSALPQNWFKPMLMVRQNLQILQRHEVPRENTYRREAIQVPSVQQKLQVFAEKIELVNYVCQW